MSPRMGYFTAFQGSSVTSPYCELFLDMVVDSIKSPPIAASPSFQPLLICAVTVLDHHGNAPGHSLQCSHTWDPKY